MSQTVLRRMKRSLLVLVVGSMMTFAFFGQMSHQIYAQNELSSSVELKPSQSAYVSSFFPDSAFGGAQMLPLSFGDKYTMVFLQFDLASLPHNAAIRTATLSATVVSASGEDVVHPRILVPQRDWCADTLTWSTKPALIDAEIEASSAAQVATIDWDMRSLIASWMKNPKENKGIVLAADDAKFVRELAGGADSPAISLTFEGAVPDAMIQAIATPASPSAVLTKHPACNVAGAMSSKRDATPNPLTTASAWMYAVTITAAALSAWAALRIIHELAYARAN